MTNLESPKRGQLARSMIRAGNIRQFPQDQEIRARAWLEIDK